MKGQKAVDCPKSQACMPESNWFRFLSDDEENLDSTLSVNIVQFVPLKLLYTQNHTSSKWKWFDTKLTRLSSMEFFLKFSTVLIFGEIFYNVYNFVDVTDLNLVQF